MERIMALESETVETLEAAALGERHELGDGVVAVDLFGEISEVRQGAEVGQVDDFHEADNDVGVR